MSIKQIMVDSQFLGEEKKPQKKGFVLFKKKEDPSSDADAPKMPDQINSLDRRLRILENRYTELNRKTQLIDKNRLNERKIITQEIRSINSDVLELKKEINGIKTKMDLIINELRSCSRKEEVDALRKYIELWEPINFITRNEVDKIIQEKFDEINNK